MPEMIAERYFLTEEAPRAGGLSVVRKAVDIRSATPVAVKFVDGSTDPLRRKIFEREVANLRSLSHPGIVRFQDAGVQEATGAFFLVLDWVEKSLSDVLRDRGPFSWDELYLDIAAPIAEALSYAHTNQVEHRDIKPGNILINADGKPLIADFGISKLRDEEASASDLTVADFKSRPYAPPESEAPVPYVRDVYSVGVLILQCLSADKIRDHAGVVNALEAVSVPPDVRRLLGKCLSDDPFTRPRNASVLAGELEQAAAVRRRPTEVGRHRLSLRLTNAAVRQLLDGANVLDQHQAANIMNADLASGSCVVFGYDRDNSRVSRNTVLLAGSEWRFTVKFDDAVGVVTAAVRLPLDEMDRLRERSLATPDAFAWSLGRSRPEAGREALDALLECLDGLEADRAEAFEAKKEKASGEALFDMWSHMLQAREELARGDLQPLSYRERKGSGREATFTLSDARERDLIGTEWQVIVSQSGRKFGRGEIVAQEGSRITLRSERKFGDLPPQGTLTPYLGPSEVSLARQRDAVYAIRGGRAARPELRDLLLDPSQCSAPIERAVSSWSLDLDDSKKRAVASALGARDIFLVEGPPGTGKTSFISETVTQFLSEKPDARILIVSQTHVAVDNALRRLDDAGVPGLVRLGRPSDLRVDTSVRHLLLDQQMAKWAERVRKRAEKYIDSEAQSSGVDAHHLRAALALRELSTTIKGVDKLEQHLALQDGTSSELATALTLTDETAQLQERLDALVSLRAELIHKAETELAGDLTLRDDMSLEDVDAAFELLVGTGEEGQRLVRLLSLQADWLQRIASDTALASIFLENARVVAGTCLGFLQHPAVRTLDIDLCILDEASKATITEALVPMARAKRWILVGDTRQLPPMDEELLRSQKLLNEHGLEREDVEETLFERLAKRLPKHSQQLLEEQYRMIRPIGDLISTCFYDGALNSPRVTGLRGYDSFIGKPVMWVDTGAFANQRHEVRATGGAPSYANPVEAKLVIDRLRTLDGAIKQSVVPLPDDRSKLEVLVIAPYRSQVDDLRRRAAAVDFSYLDVSVLSVDAVQGREADVAIFSVTRSNREGKLGFLGPEYWRRINVALSRARYGLIVVGDSHFVRGTTGALRRVIEYIDGHPEDCEIREVERD